MVWHGLMVCLECCFRVRCSHWYFQTYLFETNTKMGKDKLTVDFVGFGLLLPPASNYWLPWFV